ncbi:MAG: glycosyltransferase [Desulfuromonadaceae bacterium]|nr:glycosyltransferase [Desulfuromonadaceae bacterium]MDD5104165.1 glycosyltransferase [Desulfuromonadaceae bacterium]
MDNGNDPNFSHPAEMNSALRAVNTDFMVFMDDDVFVEAGWLDGLLACIDDKSAVVVPVHQGKAHFSGIYMADDGEMFHVDPSEIPSYPWPVQRYSSALMLLDVRKIGSLYMQQQYKKFYFDCVHAFEVWEAGYSAICTPLVSITHLCGATTNVAVSNAQAIIEQDRSLFIKNWIESGRLAKLEQSVWRHDIHLGKYVEIVTLARQMQHLCGEELLNELRNLSGQLTDSVCIKDISKYIVARNSNILTGTEPGDWEKLSANGKILYDLGAYLPALFSFRRALELKQNDVDGWVWISLTATRIGDFKLAAMARDGAFAMAPSHPALNLLA